MTTARRLPPLRTLAATCALGSSVLLTAACGTTDATRSSVAEAAPTSPSPASPAPASPTAASPTASLNRDQAKRKDLVTKTHVSWDKAAGTAVGEVPQSKLVELDLKSTAQGSTATPGATSPGSPSPVGSAGAPEWEAKVAAADGTVHRVDVDAVTGKVLRSQTARNQDAGDKREVADWLRKATRTPAQAVTTATDKTKGTVTGVGLDEHDHRLVWSVDVVTTDNWHKTTFDVDAANGKILREHVDHD